MKEIYLAGGCFWCIQDVFLKAKGVIDVVSGYCGGEKENPTYEEVKSQTTGHRETIKVIYDENITSFDDLFYLFYKTVDPFDNSGQFGDKGFSYTLALYYQDEKEQNYARRFIKDMEMTYHKTIFIALEPFKKFYEAEEYHQKYSTKHPQEFEQELVNSGRKK